MKLAVAGKGGAGKTTLVAAMAYWLSRHGRPVVAVDADPDGNLAAALGIPPQAVPEPIAHMRDLVLQRTEAQHQAGGLIYRLNPQVDDLPDRFAVRVGGVRLLVLGTVEQGGKGCMCPESALLKALLQHLLLRMPDDVLLDMEAGLEHLGRASARGVDALIAVVEPGMRSVQTAQRARRLASDIGIRRVLVVANRIRSPHELARLREVLAGETFLGSLPYSEALARADLEGRPVDIEEPTIAEAVGQIGHSLQRQLEVAVAGGP